MKDGKIFFHTNLEVGRDPEATVYLGIRPSDGREVALKVFQPSDSPHKQLDAECARMMALSNLVPGLMQVLDSFEVHFEDHHGDPKFEKVVIMELMEGSLAEAMKLWHPNHLVGSTAHLHMIRFASASLLQILAQLNDSASKSVVHRDVRPDNIMIDRHGAIRLKDLGISTVLHKLQEYSRAPMGGPEVFASWEAIEGTAWAHETSDLNSLGKVMLAMMLATPARTTPRDWDSQMVKLENDISPEWPPNEAYCFRHLVQALLVRSPQERAFSGRLAQASPHELVLAHPFFWSDEMHMEFLVVLGSYDMALFRNLRSEVHSAIEHALPEGKASWFDIVQDLEQTGKHETADYWKQEPFGLLKFIRNKYIHLNDSDMSVEVRTKLSQHVFQHRFPQLVARSWDALLESVARIQAEVRC